MLEIFEDIEESEVEEEEELKEYGFDFNTGRMTGKIVTGIEAVRVWSWFALQIPRYRFRQFSWDYGTEAEVLIGKNYGIDYEISEIKRYITDCLLPHPNISEVTDFVTSFDGTTLTASFKIVTSFGDTEMTFRTERSD